MVLGVRKCIICDTYIFVALDGRGANAGTSAPATGHALARIPINIDR